MAGIQVQGWDADFADSADDANGSWRRELSTRETKSLFFWLSRSAQCARKNRRDPLDPRNPRPNFEPGCGNSDQEKVKHTLRTIPVLILASACFRSGGPELDPAPT